jgi:O-antigen ligase
MAGAAALIALWGVVAWTRPVAAWFLPALGLGLLSYFPAALIAQAPGSVFRPLSVWVLGLAAGICASLVEAPQRRRDTFAIALAISATVVALHGLYQVIWGLDALVGRIEGGLAVADRQLVLERAADGRAFAAFPTPAALGGFLALTLPLTIGTALGRSGRARWVLFGLAGVQACGLLSSASATAAAALLAAVVLGALVSRPTARRRVLVGVAVVAALVAAVIWIRGSQLTDVDAEGSPWRLRAANFRLAGEMIADHPWAGVGVGGFGEVYPQYRRPGDNETQHVHNLPLELTAEVGIPAGLLCSGLVYWLFLAPVLRRREDVPRWSRGAAVGLAALAIQNLVDFTMLLPSLLWLAAILRGLLVRPAIVERRSRGPVVRVAALAAVIVAACVSALSGIAWEARLNSKLDLALGDVEASSRQAERATRLAPWNPDGWLYRAELGLARAEHDGDPERAARGPSLVTIERAIQLSPVRPAARIVRARLRALGGDLPGAYADAEQAARLYPLNREYAQAREALGRALDGSDAGGDDGP